MRSILTLALMSALAFTAVAVPARSQGRANPKDEASPPLMPSSGPGFSPDAGLKPRSTAMYMANWFGKSDEEASLANEADQLAQQLGAAKSDAEKDKTKTRLREVLEKQFDSRQRRQEAEIEALEAQVKKLKELVQKRQENRREIVSKRLDQILRDAQGLGW